MATKINRRFRTAPVFAVTLCAALAGPASADMINWASPAGGSFGIDGNWAGQVVPGSADVANFNQPGTYTVHFNEGVVNQRVRVLQGDVTFQFNIAAPSSDPVDDAYVLTDGTGHSYGESIIVGMNADSLTTLTLRGGEMRSRHISVGAPGSAGGHLIVDGPGAIIRATASSITTTIGDEAQGWISILNGGEVYSQTVRLGAGTGVASGRGVALVSGAGSYWRANAFNVGGVSNSLDGGTLTITDGGVVSASLLEVYRGPADVLVTGTGSLLESRGSANFRTTTTRVEDGARIDIDGTTILGSTSHFSAHTRIFVTGSDVHGNPSTFTTDFLYIARNSVGRTSRAMLTVEDGGQFIAKGLVHMATQGPETTGVLNVTGQGSRFEARGTGSSRGIFVGGTSAQAYGSAYITVTDGGIVYAQDPTNGITLWEGGHLAGNSRVEANVLNRGRIAPSMRYELVTPPLAGTSLILQETRGPASTLVIDGNLVQTPTGRLDFMLGQTHDQLHITGNAQLDGSLSVELADGYDLPGNAWFDIVRVDGTQSGQFIGLPERGKVGRFGDSELFVSYQPQSGQGVSLYSVALPDTVASFVDGPLTPTSLGQYMGAAGSGSHVDFTARIQNTEGTYLAELTSDVDPVLINGNQWVQNANEVTYHGTQAAVYMATRGQIGANRAIVRAQTDDSDKLTAFGSVVNSWWDHFVVTDGQGDGVLQYKFRLDGWMSEELVSSLTMLVQQTDLGPDSSGEAELVLVETLLSLDHGGDDGFETTLIAEVPFTYGVPFRLDVNMIAVAFNNGWIDFSGTAIVESILMPEDATLYSAALFNGQADASVYGYSAVPEPGSVAAMSLLLGFASLRRPRRIV